jgi:hypothetical protein
MALGIGTAIARIQGKLDELVAHAEKDIVVAPIAQLEVEYIAVKFERLVEVTDLEDHVIDAEHPCLARRSLLIAHLCLPHRLSSREKYIMEGRVGEPARGFLVKR